MIIAVVFDCSAKLVECDNLDLYEFSDLLKSFNEWLYEESEEDKDCLCVKKSLDVQILDISVVLRFLNENYPNCNAKVINERVAIQDIDQTLPIITL